MCVTDAFRFIFNVFLTNNLMSTVCEVYFFKNSIEKGYYDYILKCSFRELSVFDARMFNLDFEQAATKRNFDEYVYSKRSCPWYAV